VGDPRKTQKHYEGPKKPWEKTRLESEKALKKLYGLKNKKELWRTETILRKKRNNARKLLALKLEIRLQREKELLGSLYTMGILEKDAKLDDVLSLSVESVLERRLQTIVWRKGLALTPIQARQFITHGHIAINGRKVDAPSLLVKREDEKSINYWKDKMVLEQPEPVKTKKTGEEEFKEALPDEEQKEETVAKTVEKETSEKEVEKKEKEVKQEKTGSEKKEEKEKPETDKKKKAEKEIKPVQKTEEKKEKKEEKVDTEDKKGDANE